MGPLFASSVAIGLLLSAIGLGSIWYIFIEIAFTLNNFFPLKILNLVGFHEYDLEISSIGLKGLVTDSGGSGLIGFSGFIYQLPDKSVKFIGSSLIIF